MDQLRFEKRWEDGEIMEIHISAVTEYITVWQNTYVSHQQLSDLADQIQCFLSDEIERIEFSSGPEDGNNTSAFSMKFLREDTRGHFKIEMNLEIEDTIDRNHRCCFYVHTEYGLLQQFGNRIRSLIDQEIGYTAVL